MILSLSDQTDTQQLRDLEITTPVVNGEVSPLVQMETTLEPKQIVRIDHNTFLVSFPSNTAFAAPSFASPALPSTRSRD